MIKLQEVTTNAVPSTVREVHIGTWFTKKKDARAYAKKSGGRRLIYETDNGFLVI